MRLPTADILATVDRMADAFSAIVRATGGLSCRDMAAAYRRAHRADPSVPALASPRSLQKVNEAYINR